MARKKSSGVDPKDHERLRPDVEGFCKIFSNYLFQVSPAINSDLRLKEFVNNIKRNGYDMKVIVGFDLLFRRNRSKRNSLVKVVNGEVTPDTFTKKDKRLARQMKIIIS